MLISFDSQARPGAVNEDYVTATATALVMLDGCGIPKHLPTGCAHNVAWLVRQLGPTIAAELDTGDDLTRCLSRAISHVAGLHPDCDLTSPNTPSATVVIAREHGDNLDWLVLSDSYLVLDTVNGIHVITDDRLDHSDDYWVAGANPLAGNQALTGSTPLRNLRRIAALTDGAARTVEPFNLITWTDCLNLLDTHGPRALIEHVREAETTDPDGTRWPRRKRHDDATAALARP